MRAKVLSSNAVVELAVVTAALSAVTGAFSVVKEAIGAWKAGVDAGVLKKT